MSAVVASNGSTEPPKARTGRPKGYPKTGGRRKGADNAIGKEGREWLAKNSKALDVLARVASGKAVKIAGPTGKPLWHYPDWDDQKWAIEQILPRLVPALSAAETAVEINAAVSRVESVIVDVSPANPDS